LAVIVNVLGHPDFPDDRPVRDCRRRQRLNR